MDLKLDWYFDLPGSALGVVPDTRFRNEAEAIRDQDGYIIRIERDSAHDLGSNATHVSERVLDADLTISNNGTVEELSEKVTTMLRSLK